MDLFRLVDWFVESIFISQGRYCPNPSHDTSLFCCFWFNPDQVPITTVPVKFPLELAENAIPRYLTNAFLSLEFFSVEQRVLDWIGVYFLHQNVFLPLALAHCLQKFICLPTVDIIPSSLKIWFENEILNPMFLYEFYIVNILNLLFKVYSENK